MKIRTTVSEVLRENTAQLVDILRRELELKQGKLEQELHFKTLVRIFIENRIYKKIESCKTAEAVIEAVREGFQPHRAAMRRDLADTDIDMLLGVRIRRISLFDINQHREEMDKVKAELDATRKHLKNVTKFAIGHLEALLERYGPLYPRLTRSSRYDEVDVKEAAFKAFKVAYDRESGYIGHKVSGDEFKTDCTKFDRILMVFKDGHYQVVELPEKQFVGPDVVYAGVPERDRVFTMAYGTREATYVKRFTFGGTIMNKMYFAAPPKSKVLYFAPDTPELLYVKYKPAAYQRIHQQTCKPTELSVKGAKARGNQLSIKEVSSINSQPPRGWDTEVQTPMLHFV